ncbi:MAG: hypothetical protein APR55_03295 [Methanolinea sp. SDB]|nr:MAG: hypothetical protein APR55_03295 [Methanolinea sp. SDB]
MQLTRCGTALVLLITGTGALSWLFENIYSFFIFFSLAGLLFLRALVFSRRVSIVLHSITIDRSAQKTVIRRGSSVGVRTSVTCNVPPGTTVLIRDLLPGSAELVSGRDSVSSNQQGRQSFDLQYLVALLSSGHIGFRGIEAEIRDQFFVSRFQFQNSLFQKPYIWVEPVGPFRKDKTGSAMGEWEEERRSPLRGSGVIAFRDYFPGDDPRSIDWKMTAKHGKMFVREYAGLVGVPSLFVLDFSGNAGDLTDSWDSLSGSFLQAFRDAARERKKCSLVLVSGMNLIRYLPDETSLSRVRTAIASNRSYPQLVHAYRNLDAGPARYLKKQVENELEGSAGDTGKSRYLHALLKIYESFVPEMHPSLFDLQVARMSSKENLGRIYIFSLFQGDQSHIQALIYQSRMRGIRVSCEVPRALAGGELVRKLERFGAHDIQVIQ